MSHPYLQESSAEAEYDMVMCLDAAIRRNKHVVTVAGVSYSDRVTSWATEREYAMDNSTILVFLSSDGTYCLGCTSATDLGCVTFYKPLMHREDSYDLPRLLPSFKANVKRQLRRISIRDEVIEVMRRSVRVTHGASPAFKYALLRAVLENMYDILMRRKLVIQCVGLGTDFEIHGAAHIAYDRSRSLPRPRTFTLRATPASPAYSYVGRPLKCGGDLTAWFHHECRPNERDVLVGDVMDMLLPGIPSYLVDALDAVSDSYSTIRENCRTNTDMFLALKMSVITSRRGTVYLKFPNLMFPGIFERRKLGDSASSRLVPR